MRVLLDTSVLISYLRSPRPAASATAEVLRLAATGDVTLLFVEGVVEELFRKLRARPDLAVRIPFAAANRLTATMRAMGVQVPPLAEPYRPVGRDRDDDFLFAHAVFAEADYLVTWDKPLLALNQIEGLRIVSPPELLHLLREAGRL